MKKKILILLTLLFCAAISFAQFSPNPQGTAQQLTQFRGAVTGLRGTIITPNDTLNSPATPYFGALTVLPSDAGLADIPIWMSNGLYWIRFAGGSATNINDTIYTRIPIAVDSTTLPGKRILYLLHLDGVVTPGYVIWTGIGLNFWVTPANYYINYRQFNSPFTTVTLDPAPVANSRIDLFIVDTNATATKITGTVAASPLVPQTNPSAQLPLTSITVNAGDTIPAGIGLKTIYDENLGTPTEFQTGSTGTITVDFDNTDNPYWGTKAAFVSTYTDGSALTFTDNVDDTVQNGELLRFFVYFNGIFTNQFQFRLYNGTTPLGTAISINTGFGMNPNDTGRYQIVAIPLSSFNVATGTIFTKLVITMAGEDISGAKGFYLDYMQLQTGLNNINPDFTLTTDSTSGPATWNPITRVLNIPIYSGGGGNETMQNTYDNSITAGDNPMINAHNNSLDIDSVFSFSTTSYDVGIVSQIQALASSISIQTTGTGTGTITVRDTTAQMFASNVSNRSITAIVTPDFFKIQQGNTTDSSATFLIHTDSSATVDNNNIAYFDADTLKRGHIAGAGTPTLPQVLAAGRTVTTDSILSTSLTIRGKTIFDSTTIGTDYPRIGVLLNENFSGGSTPSGWTQGLATVSYTGSKATITGAAAIGSPGNNAPFTAYTSGMQFNTKRMPYEKVDFQMTVVPSTKSANALVGVAKGVLGNTIYATENIFWDLSNGSNSGKVTIQYNSNSGATVPTFTTNIDSTSKMNFSTGDTLVLYFKKRGWSVTAGIINKTTGQMTINNFNQRWNGSGGRWNLIFMNGTYVLTNAKVNVLDRKGGVWFVGDSHTGGYGNSQQSRRFPDLLFQSNYKYFSVMGLPGLSTRYFDTSGIVNEIINDAQPTKVIYQLGYNDESEWINANDPPWAAPSTKIYADTAIYPLQRAGIIVGVTGIIPRALATDIWNDSLSSLATSRGADFYDIRTPLKLSSGLFNGAYSFDGIHPNDSGAVVIANVITAKSGDTLLNVMAADTNYVQKLFGLPNARTLATVDLVGTNRDGTLVSVPNLLPTTAGWIQNNYGSGDLQNLSHSASQINAEVHVGGFVGTDTAVLFNGSNGGNMNYLGYGTNATRRNFSVVASSLNSQFTTPSFPKYTATSTGNFIFSSYRGGFGATFGGSNNVVFNSGSDIAGGTVLSSGVENINMGAWFGVTSGNNNIGLGQYSLKGLRTGSGVIDLRSTSTGAGTGSQTLSSSLGPAIIIGEGWTYNPRGILTGDIILNTIYTSTPHIWLGGITNGGGATWHFPGAQGATSNGEGFRGIIQAGAGIGIAKGGDILVQVLDTALSGTTYQSSAINKLFINNTGVAIGTGLTPSKPTDLALDVQSTTQGFAPPRMTTTQRDLLQTGLLTLVRNAAGSGYNDGNFPLAFSGGGGSGAAGYCTVASGAVQTNVVLTKSGLGYTSVPTATLSSAGAGTGATFTITIGATTGSTIYNTTTSRIESWNGTFWQPTGAISGSFSGVGTATTVFTVTIGNTMANATYNVQVTPTSALSAALFYVTNKTTTTFDVTYLAGLTGTVTYDYIVTP